MTFSFKHLRNLFILLVFGFSSSHAVAEDPPPKFQIEIVVFETCALKGWTEEFWPDDMDLIDTEETVTLRPQPQENNLLNEQVEKMTPEMGYRVLYQASWIVDALPESEAKQILVYRSPDEEYSDSRLEGSFKFWKSRFPHVAVNLELERKIPVRLREKFAQQQRVEEELLPEFWRFQIKESRKIKTGQLHYLDHPIFGALVAIKYRPDLSE